ncbi:MAG: serine/threonine-protein kinase, partial [Planctomycetota bacterium]
MTSSEDKEINNETRRGRPAGSSRPSGQDPENRKTDPEHCLNDHPSLAAELKQLFHGITAFPVEMEQPDSIAKGDTREINEVIGDFRLIRKIGTGGMARVFEAEQISLKRRVALKVLFSHLSLSDKAICKFQREAEAGARQQHPGIIAIFAAGEHNGLHYIVEELVQDGRTLADELMQLKKEKGDSIGYFREVARLFAQTADALAHAHASGVIHRDVKPTNILITPEGMPKITDFGLARITDALILSRTGEYSGTPFYMSPEQA